MIDTYKEIFNNSIKELNDENIVFEIVGSYRRGAKSSGDIDIIISDKNNNSSIFTNILDKFKSEGIIKEFLTKGKIKKASIRSVPRAAHVFFVIVLGLFLDPLGQIVCFSYF